MSHDFKVHSEEISIFFYLYTSFFMNTSLVKLERPTGNKSSVFSDKTDFCVKYYVNKFNPEPPFKTRYDDEKHF